METTVDASNTTSTAVPFCVATRPSFMTARPLVLRSGLAFGVIPWLQPRSTTQRTLGMSG